MRPIVFADRKKRDMSPRWDIDQKNLLVKLWKRKKSFADIACEVNELIHVKAHEGGYNVAPTRTARAVAIQCGKLGFITEDKLHEWEEEQQKALRRDRYAGLRQARAETMRRDGSVCAICKSDSELEFAHVVPFSHTRKNRRMSLSRFVDSTTASLTGGSTGVSRLCT